MAAGPQSGRQREHRQRSPWLDSTKFDIRAKAGANVRVDRFSTGNLINFEDIRYMLRTMIAERFQMKWHMEGRPVTAYTLVAVKPKLKPTLDPYRAHQM